MAFLASYPGLLPPPRAHAPYMLIMRRWFFGGRRPGRAANLRRTTFILQVAILFNGCGFALLLLLLLLIDKHTKKGAQR